MLGTRAEPGVSDPSPEGRSTAGHGNEVGAFDQQQPQFFAVIDTVKPDRFLRLSTTEHDVRAFLDGLKQALKERDRTALAAAMNYPLVLTQGKDRVAMIIRDSTEFQANYDRIITPEVIGAIQRASSRTALIPGQGVTLGSGANHIVNYVGISIGGGRIWFDVAGVDEAGRSGRMLIRMINASSEATTDASR